MTAPETIKAEPLEQLPRSAAGNNRLLHAAYPLLESIPYLRQGQPQELDMLHGRLAAMMQAFLHDARQAGVDEETVAMAGYCLCALLDEIIAGTAWGCDAWPQRSLLVTFHRETAGGERFFGILQWLAREPHQRQEHLEYMYVLLAFGMEGRYRLVAGGRDELAALRDRIYRQLSQQRGAHETALAPAWRQTRLPAPPRQGPRLIFGLACAMLVLLAVSWLALDRQLALQSEQALRPPAAVALHARGVQPASGAATLAQLLANEIRQRQLTLEAEPDRMVLTLRVDTLFAPASADPQPANMALLQAIAHALAAKPGRIEVTGHSDNQPTTPGQRDNQTLSLDRARAVAALLVAGGVEQQRIAVVGRGASEPLQTNGSASGRARNRRVVITLFTTDTGP